MPWGLCVRGKDECGCAQLCIVAKLLVIAVDGAELTVVSCNQDWSAIPEI